MTGWKPVPARFNINRLMTHMPDNPPRLDPQRSALLVVDLQQRLVPVMSEPERLIRRARLLVRGAQALGVPLLVTEQYPQGLGHTVTGIAEHFDSPVCIESKTRFSACTEPIMGHLERLKPEGIVVAGVEGHVCVLSTCLGLIGAGYRVFAAWDAIDARSPLDIQAARERLFQAGAVPTTAESVLFEWLGGAGSPGFKAVQALAREAGPY